MHRTRQLRPGHARLLGNVRLIRAERPIRTTDQPYQTTHCRNQPSPHKPLQGITDNVTPARRLHLCRNHIGSRLSAP